MKESLKRLGQQKLTREQRKLIGSSLVYESEIEDRYEEEDIWDLRRKIYGELVIQRFPDQKKEEEQRLDEAAE